MNKNNKLIIGLACMSLGLTACKDDYFDQEQYDARLQKSFPVENVNPNHTWAVYGSATANVAVNGIYGDIYHIEISEENPLYTSPVTLLASSDAVGGRDAATLHFSFKLARPTVYVTCLDENNRRVVQSVQASDGGVINMNFFGQAAATARQSSPFNWWQHTTRSMRVEKGTSTLTLNGQWSSVPDGFFTYEGIRNFDSKFTGASYYDSSSNSNLTFSSGLKMESSTNVVFTTTYTSNVTIVQSTWENNNPSPVKFDGTTLNMDNAGWGSNCRIHTVANVPAGTHRITQGSGESGIFFVKVDQFSLEEITINPASFAHTAEDYLNPSVGMVAATSVVENITEAQMKNYDAFTNDLIDDNNYHIMLTGGTWTETIGGSSEGGSSVSINGNGTYQVALNDNPANGESRNIIYNNDGTTVVATIQFGGTGNAAESASRTTSYGVTYTAKIARPYYLFTPLVNCQMNFEFDDTYSGSKNFVVYDNTTNSQVSSTLWYQGGSIYIGNLQANHTYKLSLADDTPLAFYGLNMYGNGTITTGGESTEPTVITHTNPGDGHHYRVASGTEITKPIAVNASFTSSQDTIFNDQVIYVEGKLNLYQAGTLNGPTIVVANGGEVAVHGTVNGSNAARIIVLPGGKITGDKDAMLNLNNGCPCYNAGTIDFEGTLDANGCDFYNCGNIDVDVLTCTSTGKLTNYGTILAKRNSDAASAYNCTFVNACYMHFTEHAGIGQLFMLPSSRLDVDGYCEFSQSWQDINQVHSPNILCDKSVVNVQTAYVTNTMFQGPSASGEYAIVKMQNVQVGNGDDIHQSLNCYFDWDITKVYDKYGGRGVCTDDHLINGENPAYANQVLKTHITKFVTEAVAPAEMSIPAGDCTGSGYNPDPQTPVTPPVTTPQSFRFCFEDNFPQPGDYDFNDCVITVTPTVTNNVVSMKITLDAVGATKQLAAALRITGLKPNDVISATNTFTDYAATYEYVQYVVPVKNDKGSTLYYLDNQDDPQKMGKDAQGNYITDFVVCLFNDAHWVMSRLDANGNNRDMHTCYYNTIDPEETKYDAVRRDVDPVEMTLTFTLDSNDKAQYFNDISHYDLFILEKNSSRVWEVHTYPFKFDQVVAQWANYTDKLTPYINSATKNYPWAIQVPGDFLYPIEWQSISGSKIQTGDTDNYGVETAAYELFKEWAVHPDTDDQDVQQWYLKKNIKDIKLVWQKKAN